MRAVSQGDWHKLRSLASRYVGRDLGQDVVQRVLMRLDASAPMALLYTAVRNEAISLLRSEQYRSAKEAAGGHAAMSEGPSLLGCGAETLIDDVEAEQLLESFALVYRNGLLPAVAAQVQGISKRTIDRRIARVRALVLENTA